MTIKKVLLVVSLFVFTASFSFAITKDSSKVSEKATESKNISQEKELKKAKNYYCEGNFEKAQEYVDKVLAVSMDNERATELKNKILLLKEKELYYKRNLINDYLIEVRRTVKEGNYYEGFLFIEKINKLSPNENLKSFYNRLSSEKELTLYTLESSRDRKLFLESIDLFVNEKFTKATELIYELYRKYPKFVDYVGMCRYYTIQENNEKRIKVLYEKAIKYFKATRLGDARNCAAICYSLDPTDVKLKILVDQISMEII
ncbi:MAG: hypothetical protein K5622_01700 [Endomicrobiaceae bacterium]|nr:hypothetical protein [Endomicrobiaceae bacterium]